MTMMSTISDSVNGITVKSLIRVIKPSWIRTLLNRLTVAQDNCRDLISHSCFRLSRQSRPPFIGKLQHI